MSLSEAVLVVADAMEKDVAECDFSSSAVAIVRGYVRELRNLVKASQPEHSSFPKIRQDGTIEGTKSVPKPSQPLKSVEEELGNMVGNMIMMTGGQSDGVIVPFDGNAPRDGTAKTLMDGEVYVLLNDGKLHFSESETEKYKRNVKEK